MKEIIFVTGNRGKRASAQSFFDKYNIKLECYEYPIVEPEINDLEYIAETKVRQAYEKVGKPCISVDAGIFINNYPGDPGFPGAFPNREMLDTMGIDGLLKNMEKVEDRTCYTKECLAYYDGKDLRFFWGVNEGTLAREKKGSDDQKIWSEFWTVFVPKNCSKTLAQMSEGERKFRPDHHTECFEEFIKWYQKENAELV